MRISPSILLLAGCALVVGSGIARADGEDPIFRHISVQKNTPAENRTVVGKGYYADLYGYYGNYYNALAGQYGAIGSYYKAYGSYYNAYTYASTAASYYYYAYYYQSTGQ